MAAASCQNLRSAQTVKQAHPLLAPRRASSLRAACPCPHARVAAAAAGRAPLARSRGCERLADRPPGMMQGGGAPPPYGAGGGGYGAPPQFGGAGGAGGGYRPGGLKMQQQQHQTGLTPTMLQVRACASAG
jgi:hypothetical protein